MKTHAGKVALITGGAGGLGKALCQELGESGFHVVVADVRAEAVEQVVLDLRRDGVHASPWVLDLTDAAQMAAAVPRVHSTFGGLQVLVNNAGIDLTVPVEELPVEQWDRIMGVNLRAPFVLSRAVMPLMRAAGRGDIINIVSTAALRAWPNASAYHASKWGLLGFSHALHTEARPVGVRVTAVIAGGMRTPFLTDRFPDIDLTTLQEPANVARTVMHVLNTPEGTVIPEIKVLPMRESSWP